MKQCIAFPIITLTALIAFSACTKDGLKQVEDICTQMDDITFMDYCYKNFDVNNDGMVSMTEATAVKKISVGNKNIFSLKGIEYFSQLTTLICYRNNISVLDISKNTQLRYLYCDRNNISALDVSNHLQLEELECHYNMISSLNISALSKLKRDYSKWGFQDNGMITITDKKEYWHSLPDADISKLVGIQWIWK